MRFANRLIERFDAIRLMFCDDARIEGVTVRDSQIYAIRPVGCVGFTVDNVVATVEEVLD